MDLVRWAIAGPGRIAEKFAHDLALTTDGQLVAVGSRSKERAADFAERHNAERSYGSYRELIASGDIDALYISTPHRQHRDIALAAIDQGIPVLVEKAFTTTFAGAKEIVDAARSRGVFCMEAMWTRFLPVMVEFRRLVNDGVLGQIRAVQGDLFAYRDFTPTDRLFDPNAGGGATLDLGVYPLSFTQQYLGDPKEVLAHGQLYPNGVDSLGAVTLTYPDNETTASLMYSLQAEGPSRMVIVGSNGWIEALPRFHRGTQICLHIRGDMPRPIEFDLTGYGYFHEIVAVNRCLRSGMTESDVMPLSDTLSVQRQMEQILTQLGITMDDDPHAMD